MTVTVPDASAWTVFCAPSMSIKVAWEAGAMLMVTSWLTGWRLAVPHPEKAAQGIVAGIECFLGD